MALRITQLACDRILQDVEEVLGKPMENGHPGLLRSFFLRDAGPSIPNTAYLTHIQQAEIAEHVRITLRNHSWTNPKDPRWELMVPRMIKHLNDVTNGPQTDDRPWTPEGGIDGWAVPLPRSEHTKRNRVACPLCATSTTALRCHLSEKHGIDTPINRYVVRDNHINRKDRDVIIRHLVQDAGELNSYRADIEETEGELKCFDSSYQSRHGLPVDEREEADQDSLSLDPDDTPKPLLIDVLTDMLIDLRTAGMETGQLYSRNAQGTYSEVLADLKEVLSQATEGR